MQEFVKSILSLQTSLSGFIDGIINARDQLCRHPFKQLLAMQAPLRWVLCRLECKQQHMPGRKRVHMLSLAVHMLPLLHRIPSLCSHSSLTFLKELEHVLNKVRFSYEKTSRRWTRSKACVINLEKELEVFTNGEAELKYPVGIPHFAASNTLDEMDQHAPLTATGEDVICSHRCNGEEKHLKAAMGSTFRQLMNKYHRYASLRLTTCIGSCTT